MVDFNSFKVFNNNYKLKRNVGDQFKAHKSATSQRHANTVAELVFPADVHLFASNNDVKLLVLARLTGGRTNA